jgi:hypothetical protein
LECEEDSLSNDGYIIYAFYDWKWYDSYKDVQNWTTFFNLLDDENIPSEDWDFIVIGENNAIIEHRTQEHFYVSMNIETM